MGAALPEGVQDTQPVRAQLRDLFRAAQWLCRLTFREKRLPAEIGVGMSTPDALSACQPS